MAGVFIHPTYQVFGHAVSRILPNFHDSEFCC